MEVARLPEKVEVGTGFLLDESIPASVKTLYILLQVYRDGDHVKVPQKQLAEALGVKRVTIARWLRFLTDVRLIEPLSPMRDWGKPRTYRFKQ